MNLNSEVKEEEMQSRPASPPLGLLDPSRLQNPLAEQQNPNVDPFVMPEPRLQAQQSQHWQRTPTMSPATGFGGGSGTPGSQRSSTGTPNQTTGTPQHHQVNTQNIQDSQQGSQARPHSPVLSAPPGSGTGGQQQQQHFDFQASQIQQHQQQQVVSAQQAQLGYQGLQESPNMYRGPSLGHITGQQIGLSQHSHHPSQYQPGYQQWSQQQMYQRQAVHQRPVILPQQRVPVPYPQGAYPQGINNTGQMTPGALPPGYPPQPSPVNRVTPGSGPNSGPQMQPQPQRPQYPQGTTPVLPQYPPGQITPTGQQFSQTTFPSPAHQLYRNQVPPGNRQYMSPSQQPPTPHVRFPPHQPMTASSPHFASQQVDLRSPSLVSPAHQPSNPGLPRSLSEMIPPMRQSGQQVHPLAPYSFLGGSNDASQYQTSQCLTTHPKPFLAGCCFHIFEIEAIIPDKLDQSNLIFSTKYHGGEIGFGAKNYEHRSQLVTHIIIDSYLSPHARLPMDQKKRLVTIQWFADVLQRQSMHVPWKVSHFPSPFSQEFRPHKGQLFSFAGFDSIERASMTFMVEAMGAKVTPFLSSYNDLCIVKMPCAKLEKANEWKVPVVNYQWLSDSYTSQARNPADRPAVDNPRYRVGQPVQDMMMEAHLLEKVGHEIKQMLFPWRNQLLLQDYHYQLAHSLRQQQRNDKDIFPNHRFDGQSPPPSEDEIRAAQTVFAEKEDKFKEQNDRVKCLKEKGLPVLKAVKNELINEPPRLSVFFAPGLDESVVSILTKKLIWLGGTIATSIDECSHLVIISGRRTIPLLEGIALGKNIVKPEWIIDGFKNKQLMDTLDYFVSDADLEHKYLYNCKRSVLRSRHRKIFEDMEFFVTDHVLPDYESIVHLIKLSGGKVNKDSPTAKYIAKCIESDQIYFVISCESDARTLKYLTECQFPIYNVDLVLCAILRQTLDLNPQTFQIHESFILKERHVAQRNMQNIQHPQSFDHSQSLFAPSNVPLQTVQMNIPHRPPPLQLSSS